MRHLLILVPILLVMQCSEGPASLQVPDLVKLSITPSDFSLVINKDSVLNDGKSNAEVRVQLRPNLLAKLKNKNVTFSVKSTFGKFSNGEASIVKELDSNGEAFDFVTSTTEGITVVNVTLNVDGVNSKTDQVKFYKKIDLEITSTVVIDNVDADNYTPVVLQLQGGQPVINKPVVFIAEKGTFTTGTNSFSTTISSTGIARAYLKYNKPETVNVKIAVGSDYSTEMAVRFLPALPTEALVSSDVTSLPAKLTSKAQIKAQLVRATGSVSEGQTVVFEDVPSIGTFFNTTASSASGMATAEYSIEDTITPGFVFIKCYLLTPTGRVFLGQNRILIE